MQYDERSKHSETVEHFFTKITSLLSYVLMRALSCGQDSGRSHTDRAVSERRKREKTSGDEDEGEKSETTYILEEHVIVFVCVCF